MTARDIRVRLTFASELHERLVDAMKGEAMPTRQGLERAIKVLTDMVMEMGRDNERNCEETCASTSETERA